MLYGPNTTFQVPHEITGLSYDRHAVTIEVAGVKHPDALGFAVPVDAFEVIP